MTAKKSRQKILVVDDDVDFLHQLTRTLASKGLGEVEPLSAPAAVLERLAEGDIALLLLDLVMPGMSGAELLRKVNQSYPDLPVIMMTAVTDIGTAVGCIKSGAFDYLTKPLDSARLYTSVSKALSFAELTLQNRHLKDFLLGEPLARPEVFSAIVTNDQKMKTLFKLVEIIAPTLHPVLVSGETGVGKELFARAIHDASGLSGEFVPVNVAGLDEVMFADMIFGHKRGAYTGAGENREGLIRKAAGGTLFLDEIGDLNPAAQMMLLRLLQEKEYYRLGSDILHQSNARIIAASNRDLKESVAAGTFRQDLFHRLTVHQLQIPPLRERSGDIPLLAGHFATEAAEALSREKPGFSRELQVALSRYVFSGNVRELLNMIRNAVACCRRNTLTHEDFPMLGPPGATASKESVTVSTEGGFNLYASFEHFPTIDAVEALLVREALRISEGNKGVASTLLGISRPTLNKKLEASPASE